MFFAVLIKFVWQNSLFHYSILLLTIVSIFLESNDSLLLWFRTRPIDGVIRELERYLRTNQNISIFQLPKNQNISWYYSHLQGEITAKGFQGKLENGRFILLKYPKILTLSNSLSRWRFVPSLLISIGVIGTFYGIQSGLANISLSSIGEDSQVLLNSSVQLLEGMKTTFSTSMMGLTASCILNIIFAGFLFWRRWYFRSLRNRLDAITLLESPERLLSRLNRFDRIDRPSHIQSIDAESIGLAVSKAIQPLYKEMRFSSESMRQSLEMSKKYYEETIGQFEGYTRGLEQIFRNFNRDIQEVLQSFSDEMTTQAKINDQQITNLNLIGAESVELMTQARDSLHDTLSNIDDTINKTNQTVQTELEQFSIEYQKSIDIFFCRQNTLLEKTLGKQNNGLSKIVEQLEICFQTEATRKEEFFCSIDLALQKIQETVSQVSAFTNSIGLSSGERLTQLKEMYSSLGDEAERIDKTYIKFARHLEQSLELNYEHLKNNLQRYDESQFKFFQQADEAVTQLSENLLLAANYLVSTKEQDDGSQKITEQAA